MGVHFLPRFARACRPRRPRPPPPGSASPLRCPRVPRRNPNRGTWGGWRTRLPSPLLRLPPVVPRRLFLQSRRWRCRCLWDIDATERTKRGTIQSVMWHPSNHQQTISVRHDEPGVSSSSVTSVTSVNVGPYCGVVSSPPPPPRLLLFHLSVWDPVSRMGMLCRGVLRTQLLISSRVFRTSTCNFLLVGSNANAFSKSRNAAPVWVAWFGTFL